MIERIEQEIKGLQEELINHKVYALIKDKEDLSSIVCKYDRLRNSRSRWIQKRSKLQGIFNHISNPVLAKTRNLLTKIIMNNSVNKLHSYNLIKELSELKKI